MDGMADAVCCGAGDDISACGLGKSGVLSASDEASALGHRPAYSLAEGKQFSLQASRQPRWSCSRRGRARTGRTTPARRRRALRRRRATPSWWTCCWSGRPHGSALPSPRRTPSSPMPVRSSLQDCLRVCRRCHGFEGVWAVLPLSPRRAPLSLMLVRSNCSKWTGALPL